MVEAAFHPLDPETAQFHLPVDEICRFHHLPRKIHQRQRNSASGEYTRSWPRYRSSRFFSSEIGASMMIEFMVLSFPQAQRAACGTAFNSFRNNLCSSRTLPQAFADGLEAHAERSAMSSQRILSRPIDRTHSMAISLTPASAVPPNQRYSPRFPSCGSHLGFRFTNVLLFSSTERISKLAASASPSLNPHGQTPGCPLKCDIPERLPCGVRDNLPTERLIPGEQYAARRNRTARNPESHAVVRNASTHGPPRESMSAAPFGLLVVQRRPASPTPVSHQPCLIFEIFSSFLASQVIAPIVPGIKETGTNTVVACDCSARAIETASPMPERLSLHSEGWHA